MWPFRRQREKPEIRANRVEMIDGEALIDVSGQTCPGYLLAINRAVDELPPGTTARLRITYPPCGNDVHAWCKEKGVTFLGMQEHADHWLIRIRKADT